MDQKILCFYEIDHLLKKINEKYSALSFKSLLHALQIARFMRLAKATSVK